VDGVANEMAQKREICLAFRIPNAAGTDGDATSGGRAYKWLDWALESAGLVGLDSAAEVLRAKLPAPPPVRIPFDSDAHDRDFDTVSSTEIQAADHPTGFIRQLSRLL
jgi:hypothetical protein